MDLPYLNDGHTKLHAAVYHGRHNEIEHLLADGSSCDVDATDDLQYRPLHYAASLGDLKAVEILLNYKAKLKATTKKIASPIYYAVRAGSVPVVELMIQRGCDVNGTDANGDNGYLHEAVVNNDVEMVKLLLRKGAKVNRKNALSLSPLSLALRCRNLSILKLLLAYGVSPGDEIEQDTTALSKALSLGDEDALTLLLQHASQSDLIARNRQGNTLLHQAILWGQVNCTRLLLESDVPVDAPGRNDATALHLAVRQSDLSAAQLLLEAGADPNKRDNRGQTALHLALRFAASEQLVDLLLEYWADTEAEPGKDETALTLALRCGANRSIIQKLICHGAFVGFLEVCHLYPGHVPVVEGQEESYIEPLLLSGAIYQCTHDHGSTPYKLYLAKFFVKNKAAGFSTDERAIHRARFCELDSFEDSCNAELERMQKSKLFDDVTYYNYLKANDYELISMARRKELYRIFERQRLHSVLFPIYESMLELNYFKAKCYTNVFDAAIPRLSVLMGIHVPIIVAENILGFLRESDMKNLSLAAMKFKGRKRIRRSRSLSLFDRLKIC